MEGVRKRPQKETAKNALDPRATCTTEATSSMLVHLRNSRRQTHDLHQLEFCCPSALQKATCDRLLDGCSNATTTHCTVQGFVLVYNQAQDAGKVQESTSGSESPSCRRRLKFFHGARYGSNLRKSSTRRAVTKRHA